MFVKPRPTDRILDLGCGPADIVDKLNGCQYVGVDHDPGYIARARKKYNGRSQFHLASIADIDVIEPSSFDIVLSIGVLHHLADAEALHLFQVARESLKPTGRLVTVDGCLTHPQKRLRRFFLGLDRGQYIRERSAYVALASSVFPDVTANVLEALIRIPYTHLIMVCSKAGNPKPLVKPASLLPNA